VHNLHLSQGQAGEHLVQGRRWMGAHQHEGSPSPCHGGTIPVTPAASPHEGRVHCRGQAQRPKREHPSTAMMARRDNENDGSLATLCEGIL